jgi:predicted RNA polymerase sigma factor
MPHVGHAATDARDMILDCLRAGPPGRYVLQAAIASLYAEAPTYEQTDWPQIVALYDKLPEAWPSPVVALNRPGSSTRRISTSVVLPWVRLRPRGEHRTAGAPCPASASDLPGRTVDTTIRLP